MAAIIFDFDGTIADGFDYVAGFLVAEAGLAPLPDAQMRELRGMSMAAIARTLGHPWWRLPFLFLKGRRRMGRAIKHIKPFDGMSDIIKKLHAEGHELFIVSSNTVVNVRHFLREHQLHTYFLEIYGGVGLFGKAPALRRLLRDHSLKPSDAIYVGDELRDVQAAQSVGMPVVAVTWGFARPADLEASRPAALVSHPPELMSALEEL